MTKISAEIRGIPELKKKLSFLELQAFPRAMSKALNSTATTVRAEQARAIKESMGLGRVGDVKRRITIRRAKPSDLRARLEYRGRPLGLESFKARQLKAGVKARAWGGQRLYPGTFIVNINGEKVFRRQRQGGRRVGRLPIQRLFGPGIANTAAKPEIAKIREKTVADVLTARLRSNLDFEVSKIVRRR